MEDYLERKLGALGAVAGEKAGDDKGHALKCAFYDLGRRNDENCHHLAEQRQKQRRESETQAFGLAFGDDVARLLPCGGSGAHLPRLEEPSNSHGK